MNLSRNDSGQLNEEAQQLIDIIDINPSNEKYAKYKSALKEKYNIDYVEPSIRYKKENDLLEKYFGVKKVKTNKGLDISIHLFKTPNLDKSITLEVFDDSLNNIARAGVGIDLQSKTIRVGGVIVNDNMRRKGVYSSIINEIEKISKENNLKMQETGRSQDAQNFWKSRNNPDIRFSLGGATNDDKTFLNNPYKIYNDKEFVKQIEESIEKDGSSFVCTFVASAIKMLEGKKVKIYGFSQKENPQALYFKDEDEDEDEGHHFAVADDRYIIDAWIYNNFEDYSIGKKFNRSVFDLKNKNDKKIIKYLYGNRNNWTDITNRVEDFKKLFPKNKLKKPDVTYKDGGNTTQDYWAGKKSGEWYSKKLRIDQLRIGKEFLLARRNFKIQKSKVDEQQKPVWNWEHRDSVYDEKGMAIGYDWYNDITDDVLLLSDLYNEFIELREEKKRLVNSNKEELEKIGYKDWIYKDYFINKRVEWDMHDSEGVLEGLGSNESIIAIGTKSYCKEIQNNEAKEEYEYYINPSKTQKGLYVLREVWLGYYLKSGGNIDDFTYDIGGL
jgi:hypothetical protein